MWHLDVNWLFNWGSAWFVQHSEGRAVYADGHILEIHTIASLRPAEIQDFLDKHPPW